MRIAWLGPTPTESGEVPNIGTLLLKALAEEDVEVDAYAVQTEQAIPRRMQERPAPRLRWRRTSWDRNSWYARDPLGNFVTDKTSRAVLQGLLAFDIAREHRRNPYDLVYQFSQLELGVLRPLLGQLPPLVLHPQVHARGELRWHRRERALVRPFTSALRHDAVSAMLGIRARIQERDVRLARMVVTPSKRYAEQFATDHGLPRDRVRVVANPVDLARFRPAGHAARRSSPRSVLFVSRLAVRKGVELVVELTHRLADLSGETEVRILGGPSLWSDYSGLLRRMNPAIGRYMGVLGPEDVALAYRDAAVAIQPSHFEPFALTVAEALASGTPVVATDAVGAAEDVDPRCCAVVASGDGAALEAAVRAALGPTARDVGALARSEAERLFAPRVAARTLIAHLDEARRPR